MSTTTPAATGTFRLGRKQVSGPLTIFPVLGPEPTLEYRSYAEAATQGFVVHELPEGASVNDLQVLNPLDVPVLLFEGEEVSGAQQDRTLDVSVLVEAKSSLRVPVSCVEAGRWDGSRRTEAFAPAPQAAYPALRALKATHAARAAAQGLEARADQSAVWSEVGAKASRRAAASPTGAMRVVFAADRSRVDELGRAFRRRPGQLGALVGVGGDVLVLDLVGRPDVWAALHGPLVRGYALDAIDREASSDRAGQEPLGRRDAERFLSAALRARRVFGPGVGLGRSVRSATRELVASGLEHHGELVQLSAFPATSAPAGEGRAATHRVRRPSRRR